MSVLLFYTAEEKYMESWLSPNHENGFGLGLPILFSAPLTVTLSVHPYLAIYISELEGK